VLDQFSGDVCVAEAHFIQVPFVRSLSAPLTLLQALASISPSVTPEDLRRYKALQNKFAKK
jgi:hypothetical protein